MLIDTHAHLYFDQFQADFDQMIQRTKEAGVTTIINIGVDVETSLKALDQAEKLTTKDFTVYSAIGIHPHEAHKYQNSAKLTEDIAKLEQIYHQNPQKVVLVGECGLDFFFKGNRDFIPSTLSDDEFKNLQRQLFQAQIDLAKKLNLPLSVHCRDDRSQNPSSPVTVASYRRRHLISAEAGIQKAWIPDQVGDDKSAWNEVLEMVKNSRGILHCYSGLPETTKKAQTLDFLISFAGNITYPKNQYLRDAATELPLSKILLETDSPFLSPQSSRGQRNEPKSIRKIAILLAQLKNTTLEEIATQTTQNFKDLVFLA